MSAVALAVLPLWLLADPAAGLSAAVASPEEREARLAAVWAGASAWPDDRLDLPSTFEQLRILAEGVGPQVVGGAAWPGLRPVAAALEACGFAPGEGFEFALMTRSDRARSDAVVRSGVPARDDCVRAVLEDLLAADQAPPDGALVTTGAVRLSDLRMRAAPSDPPWVPPPAQTLAYAGEEWQYVRHLDGSRTTSLFPLRASIAVDEALTLRIHELAECPSEHVGTALRVSWKSEQVDVSTKPPVACVDERVSANASLLRRALLDALPPDEPNRAPLEQSLGPVADWPSVTVSLWLILPPVSP